jgi:hypothetical protein
MIGTPALPAKVIDIADIAISGRPVNEASDSPAWAYADF